MDYTVIRSHEFCCGHTVTGHESKCAHLHGHNYTVEFYVAPHPAEKEKLDDVGRVVDFSEVKKILCEWVETNWDHRFLVHEEDPRARHLKTLDPQGVLLCPFNPTAEVMAAQLLKMGRAQLPESLVLWKVVLHETGKCRVEVEL